MRVPPIQQEVIQMVKRNSRAQSLQKQVSKKKRRGSSRRVVKITPKTPYGECTERLTAFGGLLALVKFLDLIGFEKRFEEHYVHPKREPKLGGYRMVLGLLMLLFIGFQRLGHFAYIRNDSMLCGRTDRHCSSHFVHFSSSPHSSCQATAPTPFPGSKGGSPRSH